MLKEWCVWERQGKVVVYVVNSQGATEYLEVGGMDEGKMVFKHQVRDGRKTHDVGASVIVRDVEGVGKLMLACFKDGSNVLGVLEADQLHNTSSFALRNNFVDILGKKEFILGQTEFVKGAENELFVVATLR